MSRDVQVFTEPGEHTWHKPAGAVRVGMLTVAPGGGGSLPGPGQLVGADGEAGEVVRKSFDADELPDEVTIYVGHGGRGAQDGDMKAGDGADGCVIVTTTLKD